AAEVALSRVPELSARTDSYKGGAFEAKRPSHLEVHRINTVHDIHQRHRPNRDRLRPRQPPPPVLRLQRRHREHRRHHPTTNEGITNFLLGFSYTWTGYAFYWDGAGPAYWRLANDTILREPVGTSWSSATGVPWGTEIELNINVEAQLTGAANRDDEVTVFIIPDDLD
ncbi:hypothetical protein FB45DRAFT_795252, partial [Roridomyces roridus]